MHTELSVGNEAVTRILAQAISYYLQFQAKYSCETIKEIPVKLLNIYLITLSASYC